MKINHKTPSGRLLIRIAAWLARLIMAALGATYRIRVIAGGEHVDRLVDDPHPVLLSFWHNRSWLAAHFLRHLVRRGLDVLVFASHSRDGELVSEVARLWKLDVVRGSASRGGREAVRNIYRAIKKRGSSPVMIPDGPRGPLYDFKVGVVVLAQMSRAPILPMGMAAERFWSLRSWDRIVLPKPFSRVVVVVGDPQPVPRQISSGELEAERLRLQALLDELTLRAEDALGVDDIARPRHLGPRNEA